MKKLFRYIIFSGTAIISLFIVFFCFTQFIIRKVIVISPEINLRGIDAINGQSLLFIDNKKIIRILKDQNPNIADIFVTKEFPNILKLNIFIRNPIVVLNSGSTKIGIDKEGILLFGIETHLNLPKIETTSPIHNFTNYTDWRITKAAQILVLLNKESIIVDRIILKDSDSIFSIFLDEGSEIIAPYSVDPPLLAASLQVIIHRFRIEGKFISRIDFRFEKPIVQLINGEKNSSP